MWSFHIGLILFVSELVMRFNWVYFFVIIYFCSCQKETKNYNSIGILGHVGTGLYNPFQFYPGNSENAINYALSFDEVVGIEVDVQISKDGGLWLFHDSELENQTNGSGKIGNLLNSELSQITYKSLDNVPLARLTEINWASNGNKVVFLDIKKNGCDYNFDLFDLLDSCIQIMVAQNVNIEFICNVNDSNLALEFIENGYEIYRDINSFQAGQQILSEMNLAGFFVRHYQLSETEIEYFKLQNIGIALFEIRSPQTIRESLNKNPNYILVEDIKSAIIEKYD